MISRSSNHDSARRPSRFWTVAFVCWVAFIWGHSLIQGPQSTAESGLVVSLLRPLFEGIGIVDPDLMSFIVRKAAHFSEYAILGVLARGLVTSLREEGSVLRLPVTVVAALVPAADECLQLFVPGRSGRLQDVLIDLCGMLFGVTLSWVVSRVARRARAWAMFRTC